MENDIQTLSVFYNKIKYELALVKEQLKMTKEELMSCKLEKSEMQWMLEEKTKMLIGTQAQENIRKQFTEKLEKEKSDALAANSTLSLQLETSTKSYEAMKQSIKSFESSKDEYIRQIQVLQSQIQEYHTFKSQLITNNNCIKQSIARIKEKLKHYKQEQEKGFKAIGSVPKIENIVSSNVALQEMLKDAFVQKNDFQEQCCYYKALSEELQKFIASDDREEDIQFFYNKWKENNVSYREIIDKLIKSNEELKNIIISKYKEIVEIQED